MRIAAYIFLLSFFLSSCNRQFYDRERSLDYSADNAFINQKKHTLCLRGNAYFNDPEIEIKADSLDIHHRTGVVVVYATEDGPSEIYVKGSIKVLGQYSMPGSKDNFYRNFDYLPQVKRIRFHKSKMQLKAKADQ
ncbi:MULTISPECIES: hypothetical protein [Flammeovirga]|uniref:Lipoprotein n=1 Tax=Flammeovirga agarivorans TaxID=2726742 RepID=A0A7X8SG99_9BACT|nr:MULTISPECIES: hypothetical protein [Flammeovirga]NLR89587.1 hypothetical protein [Flammeovirga agarivorans]